MTNHRRWGDFDLAAYKFIKKSMMNQADDYCNGRRYDLAPMVSDRFWDQVVRYAEVRYGLEQMESS